MSDILDKLGIKIIDGKLIEEKISTSHISINTSRDPEPNDRIIYSDNFTYIWDPVDKNYVTYFEPAKVVLDMKDLHSKVDEETGQVYTFIYKIDDNYSKSRINNMIQQTEKDRSNREPRREVAPDHVICNLQ